MALGIATAKAERAKARKASSRLPLAGSRLGRLILALNLLGLAVLVAGALILNELGRGLVEARIDSLTTQGELISNVIAGGATRGNPEPSLDPGLASEVLQLLFIPNSQRARLFDAKGELIADSLLISDRVEARPLPPARKRGEERLFPYLRGGEKPADPKRAAEAQDALRLELKTALAGRSVAGVRRSETGDQLVSVSIPIQRVQAVLGVLTLEAADVSQIIDAQRRALLPFILIAVTTTLASSLFLNRLVAQPILRLARAADQVRLNRARVLSLPDLERRKDEIGDLAHSLEAMTDVLSTRMDAIERFAADVSHEIKNPLTSMRSAIETLELTNKPESQARLQAILKQDVGRLDRLITDISNASRLDAELSRDAPRSVDIYRLAADITALYPQTGGAEVRLAPAPAGDPVRVMGREGPLGQVFRNLIDNARSFSPPGGVVRVAMIRDRREVTVTVEDEGPGMPPENLETVFERFYTQRPRATGGNPSTFGGHSGLGLSIVRQIAEAHGGRITASNRTDETGQVIGARFTLVLPEAKL